MNNKFIFLAFICLSMTFTVAVEDSNAFTLFGFDFGQFFGFSEQKSENNETEQDNQQDLNQNNDSDMEREENNVEREEIEPYIEENNNQPPQTNTPPPVDPALDDGPVNDLPPADPVDPADVQPPTPPVDPTIDNTAPPAPVEEVQPPVEEYIEPQFNVSIAGKTYTESFIQAVIANNPDFQSYVQGFGYECVAFQSDQGTNFTVRMDVEAGTVTSVEGSLDCDLQIGFEEALITQIEQEGFKASAVPGYLGKVDVPASVYFKALRVVVS
mgnify:CR=1 FL=1